VSAGFPKQRRTNIQILERSISQEVRILMSAFSSKHSVRIKTKHRNKMFRCVAPSFSSCVPPTPSSSSSPPPRRAYDHQNHPIILRQFIVASAALTIASFGNVQKVEAGPSFSGVDPEKSELIQNLLAKTKEDKSMLDQKRLDNYYNKKFLINEITGKEILPNPCDPRDYEFGGRCRTLPTLPRLPGETLPEFPAIVKNNSSSAAPSTQVEQLSTIEDEVQSSDSGNSSEGGIEVSNDEDVVDVVINDK
jgi:hypothetical protein